jgi:hypothetical protein
MELQGIKFESMDWIPLSQDRVQSRAVLNTLMKLWVP